MAIFVESQNLPSLLKPALSDALRADPGQIQDIQGEAVKRSGEIVDNLTTQIAWPRLLVAVAIAFLLLGAAIATAHSGRLSMLDISKALMTSFQSFSGLIVGLLGGEVAASKR